VKNLLFLSKRLQKIPSENEGKNRALNWIFKRLSFIARRTSSIGVCKTDHVSHHKPLKHIINHKIHIRKRIINQKTDHTHHRNRSHKADHKRIIKHVYFDTFHFNTIIQCIMFFVSENRCISMVRWNDGINRSLWARIFPRPNNCTCFSCYKWCITSWWYDIVIWFMMCCDVIRCDMMCFLEVLKKLSEEVLEMVKSKVGATVFVKAYNNVRGQVYMTTFMFWKLHLCHKTT